MSHDTSIARHDALLGHEPGLWTTFQISEPVNDLLGRDCGKEWE